MFLNVQDVSKKYDDKQVLQNITFNVSSHATLSILGKSGCGKSTLLKIIAGLEQQDSGQIFLHQTDISHTKPNKRNIVYLFQEPMLFPHLNVLENIAFGLKVRKVSSSEVKQRVSDMLASLELTEHAKKMPHQLSGGQKQRVAFGRAIIINPPLILLDEPFSSLDMEIRNSMQLLYKNLARQFNITALFVTHDIKEALLMGDEIAYMENGMLQVFASKNDFINDARTGVKKEIAFWNTL